MSELKRTEILFLYDVQNANPNGDPSDENKPRIDEETGCNIVTDVRLKRTVRDYLKNYKGYDGKAGKDIFIRETFVDDDPQKGINDAKNRALSFKNKPDLILSSCIDVRLFGGVIPLETKKDKQQKKSGEDAEGSDVPLSKGSSITYTGPVQFKMGHSLHKVNMQYIKGTGAFASKAGSSMSTFREEYILPYSFIAFYGIINENAAKHTGLSQEDINELLEALWYGTKNLITRSKFEHNPRLLFTISHNKPNFFIGDLDRKIKLKSDLGGESIRSISDFVLDFSGIDKHINKDMIPQVHYRDQDLKIEGIELK